MRKNIVAGNWKMNNTSEETTSLLEEIKNIENTSGAEVMVAPTFINLQEAVKDLKDTDIEVIAQNMHFAESGAYTGEISSSMLKSVGVQTVILGHSERREYFNETNEVLKQKVEAALQNGMRIIFCFGEKLNDRKSGDQFTIVENQIRNVLFGLDENSWDSIILAYEPVWAIGTGETATADQAQQMHHFIRRLINDRYNDTVADNTSILYGGSVKPDNAKDLFQNPDVDGGLIGGAALKAESSMAIVNAFS